MRLKMQQIKLNLIQTKDAEEKTKEISIAKFEKIIFSAIDNELKLEKSSFCKIIILKLCIAYLNTIFVINKLFYFIIFNN